MEEPDETKVHNPEICENCSCRLNDVIPTQAERAWVFALPKPRLFVKEHQVTVKICPCCGTENKGSFSFGIFPGTQYKESVKSSLVYLKEHHYLPFERAYELFQDLLRS